jgi:hypothetical protein
MRGVVCGGYVGGLYRDDGGWKLINEINFIYGLQCLGQRI